MQKNLGNNLLAEILREGILEIPQCLEKLNEIAFEEKPAEPLDNEIIKLFPHLNESPLLTLKRGGKQAFEALNIGVVFSGGQAPGGHNVISGIYQTLKEGNASSKLFGFLGGPKGIIEGHYVELDQEVVQAYHNQGGFDLIGSGRTKIEKDEELIKVLHLCQELKLNGLIIIGGDDSNTNAAMLAEYFLAYQCETVVVGVPKTIDGDLKNQWVEQSFGFDTACRVYSEMIGNLCRDCLSAKKYSHFIRLMGRSASHIALECALQTHPNGVLLGEEVAAKEMTLAQCIDYFEKIICARAKKGKQYGVYLLPEGLIEFIPEMRMLIQELNQLLGEKEKAPISRLSNQSRKVFDYLPKETQEQLLLDRDPHGNIQVSHIATEKLLIALLKEKNVPFNPVAHFFGYEGRCSFPSPFDATYCFALGRLAAVLCFHKKSGYLVSFQNLSQEINEWQPAALPLASLLHFEERKGKRKPVIEKALVDLKGGPFGYFAKERKEWEQGELYRFPGPIQFFGPSNLTHQTTLTLQLKNYEKVIVK
jgi:diphosphate-dependent phosphofructokinase